MESLRLIIIDASLNNAEAIASHLKNGGIAVRMTRLEDLEDLEETLEKQQEWDMIIAPLHSEGFDSVQALQFLNERSLDIPYILLTQPEDLEVEISSALELGAYDAIPAGAESRLLIRVKREMKNLDRRRALQKAMQSISESEKRCRDLIDSSRDAISYVHDGMHIYANGVYLEMFGFNDFEEIEGLPIMDMVAADDHSKFKEFLKNNKNKSGEQKLELTGQKLDGSTFDAIMELAPATIDTEPCTQIIIRDQGNNKELEKKLKYLSKQDLLTGLNNRQYFTEELELAIGRAAAGSGSSSVIFIELDNFNTIKEGIGIAGTDILLNDVAQLLQELSTDKDILARFSDHVFTVLRPDSNLDHAHDLAEEVRKSLEERIFEVEGNSISLTCSVGISLVTETAESAHAILNNADVACNISKSKGGNWIHLHDPVTDADASKEMEDEWATLIRHNLKNNGFHLVFQPVVHLHGENAENYEVLLRMKDQENNILRPGQFMPVAGKLNLLTKIDQWVVLSAIRNLVKQRQQGYQTRFFVKLSSPTIKVEEFLPWLSKCLKEARLQGSSLVFEVAEKDAVSYLKYAKYLFKGLKQLRCGIVLDHFGTSANSFNLLKHLDVDYLKIDGSFIHNLAENKQNQAMVKSLNEMAKAMGKQTIAEFVEDANSLAILWQIGVNYIQGHYLQEPYENLIYDFAGESEQIV